jgi:hypothetical protein
LRDEFNITLGEQYETVGYYVYYYPYNGTLFNIIASKDNGAVVLNKAL